MGEGFLDRLAERMWRFANTRTVFGDPIERDGVTIIPVAKFKMRFDAKRGTGATEDAVGGSGNGAVCSKPMGYLEIRPGAKTRFRHVHDVDHQLLALLGSSLLVFLTIRTVLKRGNEGNAAVLDGLKRMVERVNPLFEVRGRTAEMEPARRQ